jgi:hypothetical protein
MVLIVATLAWGLRKLSRTITLMLLFLLVMKPGFINAVYSMVQHSFSLLSFLISNLHLLTCPIKWGLCPLPTVMDLVNPFLAPAC